METSISWSIYIGITNVHVMHTYTNTGREGATETQRHTNMGFRITTTVIHLRAHKNEQKFPNCNKKRNTPNKTDGEHTQYACLFMSAHEHRFDFNRKINSANCVGVLLLTCLVTRTHSLSLSCGVSRLNHGRWHFVCLCQRINYFCVDDGSGDMIHTHTFFPMVQSHARTHACLHE